MTRITSRQHAPSGRHQPVAAGKQDIEAEIKPFTGNYRSALDTIVRFANTLRSDPLVAEVSIVALPLNVSPTTALSGSTSETVDRPTAAPFRLHLVLKEQA